MTTTAKHPLRGRRLERIQRRRQPRIENMQTQPLKVATLSNGTQYIIDEKGVWRRVR